MLPQSRSSLVGKLGSLKSLIPRERGVAGTRAGGEEQRAEETGAARGGSMTGATTRAGGERAEETRGSSGAAVGVGHA